VALDGAPHLVDHGLAKRHAVHDRSRLEKRIAVGLCTGCAPTVARTRPLRASRSDVRVAALCFRDHGGLECLGVVWAEQLESRGVGKGMVEERLVPLAFDELVRAPARPG
jgi:hypothetical protein